VLPEDPLTEVLELLFKGGAINISQDFAQERARKLYSAALNVELPTEEEAEKRVRMRLNRLVSETLRREAERVMRALHEAERRQDAPLLVDLARQRAALQRQLEQVGAV